MSTMGGVLLGAARRVLVVMVWSLLSHTYDPSLDLVEVVHDEHFVVAADSLHCELAADALSERFQFAQSGGLERGGHDSLLLG
jgi:uncharacterized membrane protein required for colicin V production